MNESLTPLPLDTNTQSINRPDLFDDTSQPSIEVGVDARTQEPIRLSLQELTRGTLVLGRPGSGKSKLLQAMIQSFIFEKMISTIVIDAEGDLCDDLMLDITSRVAEEDCDAILHRVHLLRPDWQASFQMDPFEQIDDGNMTKLQADAYLRQQVSQMSNAILRTNGDVAFEMMQRLRRWLENILIALGTTFHNGKRLPLANIFILLNVHHHKFDLIFGLIRDALDPEVRKDFETLISLRDRPNDILSQTESTINRLRSFFQPLIQASFQKIAEMQAPNRTVNFARLIKQRSIVLINLKDTQYFSPEQADALGKIMVFLIVSAMQKVTDKGDRVPCALVIDEMQRFVTFDVLRALCQGRKWGLILVLATQTLLTIELTLEGGSDVILSTVENVICGQQRHPRDLNTLIPYLYQGNLDHTERIQEVDRQRGYFLFEQDEYSEQATESKNWSKSVAFSIGQSISKGIAQSDSWGIGRVVAKSLSWSLSSGIGKSFSSGFSSNFGGSSGSGNSLSHSPIIDGTNVVSSTPVDSTNRSSNQFYGSGENQSNAVSQSQNKSQGSGLSEAKSTTAAGCVSPLPVDSGFSLSS